MSKLEYQFPESTVFETTNSTGGDVAQLGIADIGGVAAVLMGTGANGTSVIADGEACTAYTRGRYTLPKATGVGTAIPAGAPVAHAGGLISRAFTAGTAQWCGRATVAAGDNDATVEIELNDFGSPSNTEYFNERTAVSGENTDGFLTFDTGFGFLPSFVLATVDGVANDDVTIRPQADGTVEVEPVGGVTVNNTRCRIIARR